METQKFKDISSRVYNNIQSILPTDYEVLENILSLNSIKYGRIRTFSLVNSQKIILLTLKQNCLILVKFLAENKMDVPETLYDKAIALLFPDDPKPTPQQPNQAIAAEFTKAYNSDANKSKDIDIHAQMEIERIEKQIFNTVIDIVYISGYYNSKLEDAITGLTIPDDLSVNFAPLVEGEYKSFELTVLNQLILGPVLLSLLKSYKNKLRKIVKARIISELKKKFDQNDRNIIYEIFYLINDTGDKQLLKQIKSEHTPEYVAFVISLITDRDSAEVAYEKLQRFFEDLEYAMNVLLNTARDNDKKMLPRDELFMMYLLEAINKLLKYKSLNFFKLLQGLQSLLKLKVNNKIKGNIYDILRFYVNDKDVFIEKIFVCKEEIEVELKTKDYYLLPRVIKFINAYSRRERLELELLESGKSMGSPYINASDIYGLKEETKSNDNLNEYKILGLRSEDPQTVIECFDTFVDPSILKLNASHIRNAMLRDDRVTEKVLDFQIEHGVLIDDILIVNLLLCVPNPRFFKYVRLFKDFSLYLNGDVLERICDDLEEGIDWLVECGNKEIDDFILRHIPFFNEVLKNNKELQNKILPIYERILDDNLDSVQIQIYQQEQSVKANSAVDSGLEQVESKDLEAVTFYVFDDEGHLTADFFRIFAKQLLYAKFNKGGDTDKFLLRKKYAAEGVSIYIKAKIVAGYDVSSDIQFLRKNLINIDELLGYLKIVDKDYAPNDNKIHSDILMNFGLKDSAYFLRHFSSASDLEKFVLFFSLDKVDKEIECIIKEEIMKNLKSSNKLYLRMCIVQLFKCKELDHILKILEKEFDDKQLLFKLNVYNIASGGKYCSKSLINYADHELMAKAIFLLYYQNIWEKEYIVELLNKIDTDSSEELKYLMADIKRF